MRLTTAVLAGGVMLLRLVNALNPRFNNSTAAPDALAATIAVDIGGGSSCSGQATVWSTTTAWQECGPTLSCPVSQPCPECDGQKTVTVTATSVQQCIPVSLASGLKTH